MSIANTSEKKLTDLRIQRALAKPGAIGMKGLLLWTEAAFPKVLADKVLKAASAYVPGTSTPTLASPAQGGFGRLGDFVYGSIAADDGSGYSDPTAAPVSAVTAATPSQPATPSWLADLGSAFKTGAQAFLGYTQVKDAQQIFNVNLQRAQQGLPPIPTNPVNYGLPAPTANIGLTDQTQKALLWGVGLLVGGMVLIKLVGHNRAS